jgi:hypothetical protein
MLPSFRLIVATFLLGFVAVFAGLRMMATVRISHDSLPGLATQAIAAPAIRTADGRRLDLGAPAMFDLRSIMSVTATAPIAAHLPPQAEPPAAGAPHPAEAGVQAVPEPAAPDAALAAPEPAGALLPLTILPDIAQSGPAAGTD